MIDGKLLKRFISGFGAIGFQVVEYYDTDKGILKYTRGMGGESKVMVDSVPSDIEGYQSTLIYKG